MDTNGRPALTPEERASIEATEERIIGHVRRYLGQELPNAGSALTLAEEEAYLEEQSDIYIKEFDALLWKKSGGGINPEGYLALRKLRESLDALPDDNPTVIFASTLRQALARVEEEGKATVPVFTSASPFTFTREDVPNLRQRLISAEKAALRLRARQGALIYVLDSYELDGRRVESLSDIMAPLREGLHQLEKLLENRGPDYLAAVHALRGNHTHASPTAYAKAIADLAPKESGDPPEYTAVFGWLGDNGLRKPGQGLDGFRPELERVAERVLRLLGRLPEQHA